MIKQTKSQRMAQAAFQVANGKDYRGFAREFPTLIHSCGLAQAFVFAKAKDKRPYRDALVEVLKAAGCCSTENADQLEIDILKMQVSQYIRLSRDALLAAVWIKRFCEADQNTSDEAADEK